MKFEYDDAQTILKEGGPNTWVVRAGLTTNLCISHLQKKRVTTFARRLIADMTAEERLAYDAFLTEHGKGLGLTEDQLAFIRKQLKLPPKAA
jgi:hypothetical protein